MKEITISVFKANLYGFLIGLLITIPIVLVYKTDVLSNIVNSPFEIIFFFFLSLISILLHELIHALVFVIFSKRKLKSVKIGVLWKHLTPYTHCKEPMSKYKYALALISPFIVLGLIPIILSFYLSSTIILFYGLIMIFAASGDLLILSYLSKVKSDKLVLDHESKVGFWIIN